VHWRVHFERGYFVRAPVSLFLLASASFAAAQAPSAAPPEIVRYHATNDNVKCLLGVAPPVVRRKPGNMLEANSLDCFGNAIQKPGDPGAMAKGDNPLTGPFWIEGAEPGDTLVVHILDLQGNGYQGVGTFSPGFCALNATHYTPMFERHPLPERVWFYPIDHAGNTPYLPVNVSGVLLYFGDGHTAMGDGEIAGSAIEVPMRARLRVDIAEGNQAGWPFLENEKEIIAAGVYRPVDGAVRIAFAELVAWIQRDYALAGLDDCELLSRVGRIHLHEMDDSDYVVIASIEKKYLSRKK
jgi:amidase